MFFMEHWLINILLTFGIAFALTGLLIPQILLIAFRKKLFDVQDERKIHEGIVPRLGGIAFVPAIITSISFILGLEVTLFPDQVSLMLEDRFVPIMFLFCSLLLLFLVGMADDLIGVRYSVKFIFQILAAMLTISSGVFISDLYGIAGLETLPNWFAWLFTGFCIVYCVNAINLIDGIDGLAAGLAAIAMTIYGIVLLLSGEYLYSILAWAGVGSLLPFLYFNIFGNAEKCRKIFMGDTGSLTIGMLIIFLGIVICQTIPSEGILCGTNPVIIGVAPLIVPVFDVARVFLHRIKHRRNPFLPDRSHIHHKLLDLGLSSTCALSIILLVSLIYTAANIWLSKIMNVNILILCDIAVWIIGHICLTKAIRHRETHTGMKLYE